MELLRHRLKNERKRLKLTQSQLAALVDKSMGQSFISNLETGEREETPFIPELAHVLGVDDYWLKTGKGNRAGGRHLSEDEKALLDALPLLDADVRSFVGRMTMTGWPAASARPDKLRHIESPPGGFLRPSLAAE